MNRMKTRGLAWFVVTITSFLCAFLSNSSVATAQSPSPSVSASATISGSVSVPEEEVAPDSPRASLRHYLELSRAGKYAEAAQYLDFPPKANPPELAQRLKAVLDTHLMIDLDKVSPLSMGNEGDQLPPGIDEIGKIPGPSAAEPVRLARMDNGPNDVKWVFQRATVERVNVWYERLGDRWLRERLPEYMFRPGPLEIAWWQWLALPGLLLVSIVLGRLFSYVGSFLLVRLVRKTATRLDDLLVRNSRGPLTMAGALIVLAIGMPWLHLFARAEAFLNNVLRAALIVTLIWAILRAIDTVRDYLLGLIEEEESSEDQAAPRPVSVSPAARSLVPLTSRILKVAIVFIGVIAILAQFGYAVTSLLAGLGIGGIALALAAQKTVENVFGSVSIGVDRPFRVGDFVKVEDVLGTVESVGLRSTRIRTLDRTVVTIPNGKLADMQVETYAARDRIRLHCIIGVVYETTGSQMREILQGIEGVLRGHDKIWPDTVVVRFSEFGASSLDIEVMAWFQTTDFNVFRECRQEVLLGFMDVVERAGSGFAFPTRTVHLVTEGNSERVAAGLGVEGSGPEKRSSA